MAPTPWLPFFPKPTASQSFAGLSARDFVSLIQALWPDYSTEDLSRQRRRVYHISFWAATECGCKHFAEGYWWHLGQWHCTCEGGIQGITSLGDFFWSGNLGTLYTDKTISNNQSSLQGTYMISCISVFVYVLTSLYINLWYAKLLIPQTSFFKDLKEPN